MVHAQQLKIPMSNQLTLLRLRRCQTSHFLTAFIWGTFFLLHVLLSAQLQEQHLAIWRVEATETAGTCRLRARMQTPKDAASGSRAASSGSSMIPTTRQFMVVDSQVPGYGAVDSEIQHDNVQALHKLLEESHTDDNIRNQHHFYAPAFGVTTTTRALTLLALDDNQYEREPCPQMMQLLNFTVAEHAHAAEETRSSDPVHVQDHDYRNDGGVEVDFDSCSSRTYSIHNDLFQGELVIFLRGHPACNYTFDDEPTVLWELQIQVRTSWHWH
jgi:hypothetical protein